MVTAGCTGGTLPPDAIGPLGAGKVVPVFGTSFGHGMGTAEETCCGVRITVVGDEGRLKVTTGGPEYVVGGSDPDAPEGNWVAIRTPAPMTDASNA